MVSSASLEWNNLNVTIEKDVFDLFKCKTVRIDTRIIKNATGYMESGELIAVLGPSGSGKTTLLAAISKRFRGHISGEVLFNGQPINRKDMTKISCFIPQFDITVQSLTAREHLYFMAELKLNRNWSKAQKNERIERLLWKLGLNSVADRQIKLLSGGERKKLNLATDLLTDPPIVFCDEPTTGLDSFSALNVITTLKNLTKSEQVHKELFDSHLPFASNGNSLNENHVLTECDQLQTVHQNLQKVYCRKAIMCTIHQPNSELFHSFSHIILMNAGECVFQGSSSEAEEFFASLGFRCPVLYNPAEYYVRVISGANDSIENGSKHPVEIIKSVAKNKPKKQLSHGFYVTEEDWQISWFFQVVILLRRSAVEYKRNYKPELIHFFILMVPFMTITLLFYDINPKEQVATQNIQGAILSIISQVIFSTAYGVMFIYPLLMPILRRETGENIYQFSAFYTAKLLMEVPRLLIICSLSLGIPYYFTKLSKGIWVFFQMLSVLTVAALTSNSYGFMLSGFFKGMMTEAAAPFDILFLAFSGFYLNLRDYPIAKHISPFFFTTEAVSIMYWHDIDGIDCPAEYSDRCYRNGTEVLEKYAFHTNTSDVWFDYVGLVVQAIIMHCIAYICIRRIIRVTGYY